MEINLDNEVKNKGNAFSKMDYMNLVNTLTENKINAATRETRIFIQQENEKMDEMMRE